MKSYHFPFTASFYGHRLRLIATIYNVYSTKAVLNIIGFCVYDDLFMTSHNLKTHGYCYDYNSVLTAALGLWLPYF